MSKSHSVPFEHLELFEGEMRLSSRIEGCRRGCIRVSLRIRIIILVGGSMYFAVNPVLALFTVFGLDILISLTSRQDI